MHSVCVLEASKQQLVQGTQEEEGKGWEEHHHPFRTQEEEGRGWEDRSRRVHHPTRGRRSS